MNYKNNCEYVMILAFPYKVNNYNAISEPNRTDSIAKSAIAGSETVICNYNFI